MVQIARRTFLSATAAAGLIWHSGHWCLADEKPPTTDNPFLLNNFAPVHEEITADNLKVIGRVPADLDGMFLRNGPNPQFPPKRNYHLFEGDGMIHGVRVRGGKASYRNRWVRTAAWKEENQAGRAIYSSILDPVDLKEAAQHILSGKLPIPNRANTALVWHHDKLLALWEGGPPHEIKVPGLDTAGLYTFGGKLKQPFTAHPKIDAKTGELMFLGYSPFPPFLQYGVLDRAGNIVSTTPIELPRPVMMHDLAITEKHTVFLDTPGVFDLSGALSGKPIFRWEPKYGARIGVLPRHAKGDQVKWFEIKPCFVFHVFNAYENGDEVVLFACRFPEYPKFVDLNEPVLQKDFEERANAMAPLAYRWRLNMKSGAVSESTLDDVSCEFPRIDDALAGSNTHYGYGSTGTTRSTAFVKLDFKRDTHVRHDFGKGRMTGEGVFVRRRDGKTEDDGYLVSLLHDHVENRSEMVVVDCRAFTEPPVARILLPQRVPFGFHGMWLDGEAL
jgi:carotenoid cleavage dioxygenase-like enzyme